jgi:hypothetical protein
MLNDAMIMITQREHGLGRSELALGSPHLFRDSRLLPRAWRQAYRGGRHPAYARPGGNRRGKRQFMLRGSKLGMGVRVKSPPT